MTYAWPAWEFAANNHLLKLQRLQKVSSSFEIFQGAHRFVICTWLLYFRTYDYIAAFDKSKPVTENIRSLNLAVVKHTTVQMSRLLL
jgi:hypothetical protein